MSLNSPASASFALAITLAAGLGASAQPLPAASPAAAPPTADLPTAESSASGSPAPAEPAKLPTEGKAAAASSGSEPLVAIPPRLGHGTLAKADVRPQTIEQASLSAGATASPAVIVKIEVLLDRAHVSPGEIDGRPGSNLREALAAYEGAHHLGGAGQVTPEVIAALAADKAPITERYVITDKDEDGPFIGHVPSDFYAQSKLHRMGYLSPEQELAERFHTSPDLLEAMNPGADFSKVGATLTVLRVHGGGLGGEVAKIEVDKASNQVRAVGADGSLVASFPATIGSTERPAPSGTWAVAAVRKDPVYTYDPKVLTWGPRDKGRFTIKPGPNNPTGVVWIALSKPTYGIHGTPVASLVGKTASHGCVRLTNWDAWDLGNAVKAGAPVVFVGEKAAKT